MYGPCHEIPKFSCMYSTRGLSRWRSIYGAPQNESAGHSGTYGGSEYLHDARRGRSVEARVHELPFERNPLAGLQLFTSVLLDGHPRRGERAQGNELLRVVNESRTPARTRSFIPRGSLHRHEGSAYADGSLCRGSPGSQAVKGGRRLLLLLDPRRNHAVER